MQTETPTKTSGLKPVTGCTSLRELGESFAQILLPSLAAAQLLIAAMPQLAAVSYVFAPFHEGTVATGPIIRVFDGPDFDVFDPLEGLQKQASQSHRQLFNLSNVKE